jgi:hypothetical protein
MGHIQQLWENQAFIVVALVIDTEEKTPRKPTVQRMRRMHVLLKSQTNQNTGTSKTGKAFTLCGRWF